MCGDLDEEVVIDTELYERFVRLAEHHGVTAAGPSGPMPDLGEPAGRAAYMDTLFSAGLARALGDAGGAREGQRVDAIAAQAIAFARLAGFLAGQLPPEADLFRAAVEALSDGHAMPGRARAETGRRHDHHHGHDHDH